MRDEALQQVHDTGPWRIVRSILLPGLVRDHYHVRSSEIRTREGVATGR